MNDLAKLYTTHLISSPTDRWVIAACEQVGCVAFHQGWTMTFDEASEAGRVAAAYLRSGRSGRTYRELARTADGLSVFRFESHQRCFAEHKTRPELYVVHAGAPVDHSDLGNPYLPPRARAALIRSRITRRHTRPVDFVEDLHETLDRRRTSKQRG